MNSTEKQLVKGFLNENWKDFLKYILEDVKVNALKTGITSSFSFSCFMMAVIIGIVGWV